ncbi:hypothetical protein [Halobacillus sp. H74]|uniref:hypothetical protein n=1 Tax=Halobacillus sp. H74 TaxID=3457436 RepID=UPI003FCD4536
MNNFERNYWLSYAEFIKDFKRLSYLGISIPLVSPYYVLIYENKKIHDHLLNSTPNTGTKRSLLNKENHLQSLFDVYLSPVKQKITKNKGKVVFYDNVLRIPAPLLKAHFPSSSTILLKPAVKKVGKEDGVVVDGLNRYQSIKDNTIKAYERKAEKYIDAAKPHPIYSNSNFRTRFINQIPKIMKQIVAAKKFFESNSVSCLVVGTTNSSDTRILSLVASSKGIPTVCLQHGVIMLEFGYLPLVATYQAVYGKFERDWYASKGAPAHALKEIGHPRFDEISVRKPMKPDAFRSHFGVSVEDKAVLLVIHHLETDFPQSFLKQIGQKKNVKVIVKQRNGKQRNSAKTVELQKSFPHIKFADDTHLYDLLHNVDAVVSYESTIILEAMLAGKPVFLWKLKTLVESTTNYYKGMAEYMYESPQLMIKHLMITLEGKQNQKWEEKRKEFLAGHYTQDPRTASEQLKVLIDSITL